MWAFATRSLLSLAQGIAGRSGLGGFSMLGWVLGLLLLSPGPGVHAQVYTFGCDAEFHPSEASRGFQVVERLCGAWQAEERERPFRVPFSSLSHEQLHLRREFFLRHQPPDTLYFYAERIAGQGAVYLNGRLMALLQQPYAEHLIPLPPEVLNSQWNKLSIDLHRARSDAGHAFLRPADAHVGLYRPAYLLERSDSLRPVALPRRPAKADSTLILPLANDSLGLNQTDVQLRQQMEHLVLAGHRRLYVPSGLPNRLLPFAARQGIQLVEDAPGPHLALHHRDGYEDVRNLPVWRRSDGFPAPAWGTYAPELRRRLMRGGQTFLTVIFGLCLGLVALWRVSAPQRFAELNQLGLLRAEPRGQFRLAEASVLAPGPLFGLSLMRLLMLSVSIALFFQQLFHHHAMELLDILSTPSVLHEQLPAWAAHPWWLSLRVLGYLLGVHLAKYILASVVAQLYGLRGFLPQLITAEIEGSFPLIGLPLLMGFLPLVVPQLQTLTATQVWWGGFGLYWLVYLTTLWRQLRGQRGITNLGTFLYICILEVLPVLWLV